MVRVRAEARALALVVDVDPALPALVRGDERKLRQVLLNLLGNAVKFTEAGTVTLRAAWEESGGGRASFQIEDSGPGIPAEERELARMRIAQINDCVACSDFRAPSVLDAGIAPELYENVAAYATYPGYTPRQRLAIEYAERFANDHASIDDAFFGRLRNVFGDEEILDLTLCVAVFLGLGRSLTVLGVDQSCAIDV